jgi:hypothetical protein
MGQIIQLLILGIGDLLPRVFFYINVQSKNRASKFKYYYIYCIEEGLILNARLDIKVECAMSATTMNLMAIYTAKLELLHVKYVPILEFKVYRH